MKDIDETTTPKAFGKQIKTLRERKGLSQARLAELAGVSDVYISLIERGLRMPSYEVQRSMQHWLHNFCYCPCCLRRM